ncbi:MAG: DoxX family protein [Candidatus Sericytochromatia bacterium]
MIAEERKNYSNVNSVEEKQASSILVKPLVDLSTGLFLLRLILAIVFIAHGGQKVFGLFGGYGLEGTANFMATLGIPKFLSYIASLTEFFGALAVLIGLLTRPAALGLAITMIVGILKAHLAGGFFAPNGFEYALTLAFIATTVFLLGAGKYSVDEKLFKK